MYYCNFIVFVLFVVIGFGYVQDFVILFVFVELWCVIVGYWEVQVELIGDGVVVLVFNVDYVCSVFVGVSVYVIVGCCDVLIFEWCEFWQLMLCVESCQFLDLWFYVSGGMFEFDFYVVELGKGGFSVKMGCGVGCECVVNFIELVWVWVGRGWQYVVLFMSCFICDGVDFFVIILFFVFEGMGSGCVSVVNVYMSYYVRLGLVCFDYCNQLVILVMFNEVWFIDWWKFCYEQKLEEKCQFLVVGMLLQVVFIGDFIM